MESSLSVGWAITFLALFIQSYSNDVRRKYYTVRTHSTVRKRAEGMPDTTVETTCSTSPRAYSAHAYSFPLNIFVLPHFFAAIWIHLKTFWYPDHGLPWCWEGFVGHKSCLFFLMTGNDVISIFFLRWRGQRHCNYHRLHLENLISSLIFILD